MHHKLAGEERERKAAVSRELDRLEREEKRGQAASTPVTTSSAYVSNQSNASKKQRQGREPVSEQQSSIGKIPPTEENKAMARIIREEISNWETDIGNFNLPNQQQEYSLLTKDFRSTEYQSKHGLQSLLLEFGDAPLFNAGSSSVVTMAADDRKSMLDILNNASTVLHKRIGVLRKLHREHSLNPTTENKRKLKEAYLNSKNDLESSQICRKSSQRSSEVLQATVLLARRWVGEKRN